MAYTFQVFVFKAVLTSAQMNQVEVNVRDHQHGVAGVLGVPDGGLSANVALKNIDNAFTALQTIVSNTSSVADAIGLVIKGAGENISSINFDNAFGTMVQVLGTKAGAGASANDGLFTINLATDSVLSEKVRVTSNGDFGIGATPTAKLHVAGTGLFTGDLTIKKSGDAHLFVDATTGISLVDFNLAGVLACRFSVTTTNKLHIDNNGGGVRVSWDLSTNPGTLTLGSIPDARLTANIPLLSAGTNVFTGQVKIQGGVPGLNKVLTSDALGLATWEVNPSAPFQNNGNASGANRTLGNTDAFDLGFETSNINRFNITAAGDISIIGNITQNLTVKGLNAAFIADATTGTPRFVANRAGVQSLAIASPGTNLLNFEDNTGSPKVTWDLSPAGGGKLTQGNVPLARLEGQEVSTVRTFTNIPANNSVSVTIAGFTGLTTDDYFIVSPFVWGGMIITVQYASSTEVNLIAFNIRNVIQSAISRTYYIRVVKRV